jgi:hypothetical protein
MAELTDINLLSLITKYSIDKIVSTGTIVVVNDGNTTASGSGDGDQLARIVNSTISNPYGKKALCRFVWSIDGVNFNAGDSHLIYSYTTTFTDIPITSPPLKSLAAAVAIGVSEGEIIFSTANGSHGDVSRLSSSPITSGYTPTPRTFTIKYALFSLE